ncbi:protein-disulfide reductase DsbD [Porticoccaceae bacterium]|jgi:thiol:disulfide interchange protein DsbD|nr:protein-disulfide reductase DsbD [Porticoccaceae bacterium]MDB9843652.1 protein-disulfide reductase DsbD [Porticoccaceae bacterium]CAI8325970.1 MAG: Thiol:disulfide interchange protein DsbD [SAR92 bacterium MED-G29]|tara:strand:- start:11475 stop:13265 length:1791 start_codon:yes stop_codon:yes gene_type:complete
MNKLLKRSLLLAIFVATLSHSLFSASQISLSQIPLPKSSGFNNSELLTQSSNSFIPVEQAYQLAVSIEGQQLRFDWTIADGYYLYRDRFKFNAVDPSSQLSAPTFETGKVKWDDYFEADLEVYYHSTIVTLPFNTDAQQIELQIESQGCADAGLCYPPYKQWVTVDLASGTVDISTTPSASAQRGNMNAESPDAPLTLAWILLFALAGGMILNLMPCVFPVLSIKALSFTRTHLSDRSKQIHGLAYTAGVVSSFVAIAVVMLALRSAGEAVGWGFQLQSPAFIIALIYLFFVMGLAFSGYLEIGTGLMSMGQSSNTDDEGLTSSFLTGVLATTVASPCTAPFMGPALGFAVSQSAATALLVFAVIGLGMALPFILLTWIPGLSQRLPKPGQWMDTFKQFLAFPLYMTAVWLIWVAGRQTSIDVVAGVIIGLILIAMAIWLWKLDEAAGIKASKPTLTKLLAGASLVAAIAIPGFGLSGDDQEVRWETYSPERLSELRDAGKPVFINLTADWCITCLANEKVALSSEEFYQALQDNGITYLKGDWTHSDPGITQLLNEHQRSGVPLYLLYPQGSGKAQILPQILLPAIITDALNSVK